MINSEAQLVIKSKFSRLVEADKRLKQAFLLVDSEKVGIKLRLAEGDGAHTSQVNHLASVGKLFTATLIAMLHEKGELNFNDPIDQYLDKDLISGLHIYKGKDYSHEITIRHLLMQTSGLNDVFYKLMQKKLSEPEFLLGTREAVLWGKENLQAVAVPGKRHFYTDTNYYLLGFILEYICGKEFHEIVHDYIFNPLKMDRAYLHGFSDPEVESGYPPAGLYFKNTNFLEVPGLHHLDYAGGSVMAPLEDFLVFMKALVNGRLISLETLNRMIDDDISMGFPTIGFKYGYSIWKPKAIPILMPRKWYCWGCVGATGAFSFYHPETETYVIGTFNDFAYRGKALEFMFRTVIKELLKVIK